MILHINGQLEIDFERGVLYFHGAGNTPLRICGLCVPEAFDPMLDQIDITLKTLKYPLSSEAPVSQAIVQYVNTR